MRLFALALITAVLGPACLPDDSSDSSNKGGSGAAPIPEFTFQIDTPDRDITILPGASVDFSSTPDGGKGTYETAWVFEGGVPEASELEDPGLVRFDALGSYEVSATASDSDSSSSSAADSVIVNVKAIAANIEHPSGMKG